MDAAQQLTFDLERLSDRPVTVRFDFPAALLDGDDEMVRLPGNVTGEVMFARVGQDVVANGTLSVRAVGACARCLADSEVTLTARVDELWVRRTIEDRPKVEDEEDIEPTIAHQLTGQTIELGEVFRDILLAELPDRFLCAEDCRGLCPHCGTNLNAGECSCSPETAEPPTGGTMADWKQQLKSLRLDS